MPPALRSRNLPLVVDNPRFLILPWSDTWNGSKPWSFAGVRWRMVSRKIVMSRAEKDLAPRYNRR